MAEEFLKEVFTNEDYSGQDMSQKIFYQCSFSGCNFSGAQLDYAEFEKCTFKGCNFSNPSIQEAVLDGLEFSVGSSFEARPSTNKWAPSSKGPGKASAEKNKTSDRRRKREIQLKPSR